MTRRPPPSVIAALVGMACLFGASFTATDILLAPERHMGPFLLLSVRLAMACAVLGPAVILARKRHPWPRLHSGLLLPLLGISILEPGLYYVLETVGIGMTTPDRAAIAISTIPFFLLGLGAVVLKERVGIAEWLWIGVGFSGLAWVLAAEGFESGTFASGHLRGDILCLCAAVVAAIYSVLVRKHGERLHFLHLTTLQAFTGLVLYAPLAAWETRHAASVPVWDGPAIVAILFLGLGCSVSAYLLMNYAIARVEARVVSPFINLVPAMGLLSPWLVTRFRPDLIPGFRGLGWNELLGAGLVIVSLFMIQRHQRRSAAPAA